MNHNIIAKTVALAIVFFFLGASLVPIIESSSTSQPTSLRSNPGGTTQLILPGQRGYFYAFNAYDPNGMQPGPVTFDMDAVVTLIAPQWEFITGSDFDPDGNWYVVALMGGLYSVDPNTGSMTLIAITIPLNSLVYDTTTSIGYTCTDNNLYTINITTGAMTFVGSFGPNISMSILMVDLSGNMYGFGSSGGIIYLYFIDKTTGEATPIGDTGFNYPFMYPLGATFDRNDNTLYVSVYDIGQAVSYLVTCDPSTGVFVIINMFTPIGIEIDALAIPYTLPDHILIANFTWTPPDPLPSETILFNASASYDSGGDIILYEWDWNNDGVYEESHTIPTATHSWNYPGEYLVWLRVTDDTSLTARKVKVVSIVNHPPEPPIINGPTEGAVNTEYTFWINLPTDPDGDEMFLRWDWGDGTITNWLGPYPSGSIASASHMWIHAGVYEIRAQLKDPYGAESNLSDPHILTIYDNHPPETPDIQGTTTGKPGAMYLYTFTTTDPETDEVFYYIDWGDGQNTSWLGPYSSGAQKTASHSWSHTGTYQVRIKAKDTWGAESDWKTLQVSMPLILNLDSHGLLTWLLTQLPHAALFFSMNAIPLGESLPFGTSSLKIDSPQRINPVPLGESRSFNFTINGTMRNGWYVTPVVITIDCGSNHTYYKLRAADLWTEYTSPITVSTDGIYELYLYYVDPNGGAHIFGPFPFKIDMTPPTIILTVTGKDHHWVFNVTCSDVTSGIAKVEFFVDNISVGNATAFPYTFTYIGNGKVAQAAACDMAGNVGWSNIVQDLGLSVSSQPMLSPNEFLSVQQHLLLQY